MDFADFKKIEEMFKHHIGIMSEDFQYKLDLVVEGQQMVSEKVDRLEASLNEVDANLSRRNRCRGRRPSRPPGGYRGTPWRVSGEGEWGVGIK